MRKPDPVVTYLDVRRIEVSCGDQSVIITEDWGSPPECMIDWTVEGISGYWGSLDDAIGAAQDLVLTRYDLLRDLVRRVCHGEGASKWAEIHDFDGDHRFQEMLLNTSDRVVRCLDRLLKGEPLTLAALDRASAHDPTLLHSLDGYVKIYLVRNDGQEVPEIVTDIQERLNVRHWQRRVCNQQLIGISYKDVVERLSDISPYMCVVIA